MTFKMTLKTQTLFIFSFASLATIASLAFNPIWFWLHQVTHFSELKLLTAGQCPHN